METKDLNKTYREIENELEEVINRVENDSYEDLDQLLKDYDLGMKLINELQDKLEKAKNKIKKVDG